MSYNGWKNYETWAVSMWVIDDEYLDAMKADVLTDLEGEVDRSLIVSAMANHLKDFIEQLPEVETVTEQATLAADLLGAALSEVDWYEIAESYMQEVH